MRHAARGSSTGCTRVGQRRQQQGALPPSPLTPLAPAAAAPPLPAPVPPEVHATLSRCPCRCSVHSMPSFVLTLLVQLSLRRLRLFPVHVCLLFAARLGGCFLLACVRVHLRGSSKARQGEPGKASACALLPFFAATLRGCLCIAGVGVRRRQAAGSDRPAHPLPALGALLLISLAPAPPGAAGCRQRSHPTPPCTCLLCRQCQIAGRHAPALPPPAVPPPPPPPPARPPPAPPPLPPRHATRLHLPAAPAAAGCRAARARRTAR